MPSRSPPRTPLQETPQQPRRRGRPSTKKADQGTVEKIQTNGWHESDLPLRQTSAPNDVPSTNGVSPYRPQRLNLKVRRPVLAIQHPENVLPEPKHSSFREWFEQTSNSGPDSGHLTNKEARRQARVQQRILENSKPGGLLSEERCTIYQPDEFEAPPPQFARQDYMLAHMNNFRTLLEKERRKHREKARSAARQCLEKWREWQPKTDLDLEDEYQKAEKAWYSQILRDLSQKWRAVAVEVEQARLHRWEEEQQALDKEALNKVLEQSGQLLDARRAREGSDESEDEDDDSSEDGSQSSSSGDNSADEDNMSSSQSESDENQAQEIADNDEGLTVEQLRQKYRLLETESHSRSESPSARIKHDSRSRPSNSRESPMIGDGDLETTAAISQDVDAKESSTPVALDEVDDILMDDSDESTNMDDDMGSSDEQFSDAEESDDGSEGSEESEVIPEDSGLLGFFSKKEYQAEEKVVENGPHDELGEDQTLDIQDTKLETSEDEVEEVSLIPDATQVQTPAASQSEEVSIDAFKASSPMDLDTMPKTIPNTSAISEDLESSVQLLPAEQTPKEEPKPLASLLAEHHDSLPTTPVSTNPLKTSVPSLLRGTLREYQHFGLDWLAGLYANHTNGILADEMGLGKTIQTIALLAHLALEHEIWGPHLIVVPTSVMLNWEVEFKKFLPGFKVLTYYGTQEERKEKRKGWNDHLKWNVWITSYALATQDNQIFRRKAWHYMVLDEAHHIKNFRSQRWQTLLRFNTRARLLLTGTPLQNNLTELWSLLYFLMPDQDVGSEEGGFAGLRDFSEWFRKPVEQILEHGKEKLDQDAKAVVTKLHKLLRPYLLRRLKADVEKQMPGKYEHVVYCRLSKRQRYLYDGFMSRASTRETIASGNFMGIINCLMQLRKVCCHPDLFETRQIVTSFAMPKSAVADYEIKELLVRKHLLGEDPTKDVNLNVINLLPGANERLSALDTVQKQRLGALGLLRQLTSQQWGRVDQKLQPDESTIEGTLNLYGNNAKRERFEQLRHASYLTSLRSQRRPLYSYSLMDRLMTDIKALPHTPKPASRSQLSEWYSNLSPAMADMVMTLPQRSNALETTIQKFGCVTPAAIAHNIAPLALSPRGVEVVREAQRISHTDAFHEARMRLSIAFPDKRLLQYDCGKLQRLDALLRKLQEGGHRALIFTQMTRILDILEQFLNIHGHRYLRLDGSTKVEQRQILTERFNNDNRILAFILSSRSGGLGLNLTGADTVIFYDLDWNPAMDKQCQDRCHRIGQTRDVHIYRLVSEHTIEANILKKANQKRLLDDVVIQEGEFTTDYFNNLSVRDMLGEGVFAGDEDANQGLDRVLGSGRVTGQNVFEQVEDQEDVAAAKLAEKEIVQTDAADFDEKGSRSTTPKTPGESMPLSSRRLSSGVEQTTTLEAAESGLRGPGEVLGEVDDNVGHVDDYMTRFVEWDLKDVSVAPTLVKDKKKGRKSGEGRGLRKGR